MRLSYGVSRSGCFKEAPVSNPGPAPHGGSVGLSREYWMIYGGQGFLVFVCFGSSPTQPHSRIPAVSSTGDTQEY